MKAEKYLGVCSFATNLCMLFFLQTHCHFNGLLNVFKVFPLGADSDPIRI